MIFRLKLHKSLLNSFLHQTKFTGNLLVVTAGKHFIQLLHSLVVGVDVLSLRLNFVVEFECSGDNVFGLDNKVVEVLLLV